MSALRTVGSGMGCALFAGLGALIGSEIAVDRDDDWANSNIDSAVGGAIVGSAIGALLIGALAGAGGGRCREPRFP